MAMPVLPVFIFLLFSSFCQSDDQLTQVKPLSPGDKLISKGGIFALGFFSPTNSNKSLYIGIWYHGIPERTIIWVANRDNPITNPSFAKFSISNNVDLVLSDSHGQAVWKATISSTTSTAGAPVFAVLLDSGNFVLQWSNNTVIWQSFDHPTDTILPNMMLLLSNKPHEAFRFFAWKGPDDPSSGNLSCGLDPNSNLQIFIWHGTQPYWRTGVLEDSLGSGLYQSNVTTIFYQSVVNIGDKLYYRYTVSEGSAYTRILLDYTGNMKFLTWNSRMSSWAVMSVRPRAATCDLYASCGPFSYCDHTRPVSTCRCLEGFKPIDNLNSSRGCQRNEKLKCGKKNSFVTLPEMKVPDKFLHIKNRSFDQCAADCSNSCSCLAYAYANLSSDGTMSDPSRCLVWTEDLVDMGKAPSFGENLYLRRADYPGDVRFSVHPCVFITCITLCAGLFSS